MQVDKENAVKLKHNNRTYYFCCENCKKKFLAQGPSKEPQRPQTKNIYTCPMHPEISSGEPGDCPKCGMRLEPKLPPAEQEDDNNEEKLLSLRFWASVALTTPVAIMSLGEMNPVFNLNAVIPCGISRWLQFLFSTPVVLWAGNIFLLRPGNQL